MKLFQKRHNDGVSSCLCPHSQVCDWPVRSEQGGAGMWTSALTAGPAGGAGELARGSWGPRPAGLLPTLLSRGGKQLSAY